MGSLTSLWRLWPTIYTHINRHIHTELKTHAHLVCDLWLACVIYSSLRKWSQPVSVTHLSAKYRTRTTRQTMTTHKATRKWHNVKVVWTLGLEENVMRLIWSLQLEPAARNKTRVCATTCRHTDRCAKNHKQILSSWCINFFPADSNFLLQKQIMNREKGEVYAGIGSSHLC